MTIQAQIAELLIKFATDQEHPLKSIIDGKSVQEVCYLIYHSYRGNEHKAKGLRLSDEGLMLLKTFFQSHTIQMPGGYAIKLPHLLYLDRTSIMPYWISDESVTLFDMELGAMLKIASGSFDQLINSSFRLDESKKSSTRCK